MPDIPSSPGRLDLGLDVLLEDDGDRSAPGVDPARKLGQSALDDTEFLSPDQRKRILAATPGPLHAAPARQVVATPPRRSKAPLVIAGLLAAMALAAAAVLLA